jgi:predicted PurR-regulated permease PerM
MGTGMENSRKSRFTPDRVFRVLVGLSGAAVLVAFVWYFSRLVVYLVVGALLAYSLRPVVYRARSWGLGQISSIALTFVVVLGAISILVTYLIPFVATEVSELSRQVSLEMIVGVATSLEERIATVVPIQEGAIISALTRIFETLFREAAVTEWVGSVLEVFTNLFYAVVVIPFIAFFFLKDEAKIRRTLLKLVPNRYFEMTLSIVEKVEANLGRYLQALSLQCLSVGIVATLMLSIVGLRFSLAVGIFTGLANAIPYFGPFMGFVAGALAGVAQTGDFSLVSGVLVAMLVTQVSDNLLFQPFIFSRAAKSHPLIILFVVLIGAQLGGIVGMLVAIPLTTTIRVVGEQILWSVRNYAVLRPGV